MISNGGRQWKFGPRIGQGGFGEVRIAESADCDGPVVAKFVRKAPGAERELLFVDLGNACNVVPIIDWGETDSAWVIVMPQAEKSLRQHLIDANGPLDVPNVVAIMTDIAIALVDINENGIVHRDIKPENILYLKGKWRLADFGISRYADATTAPETRKYALSPPYAAPERWRDERATAASDIYSLGVIAHELLTNSLPFGGPELHNFRKQHLHDDYAGLQVPSIALEALIDECLYKAPTARPTPANLARRLERVEEPAPSSGLVRLRKAHRAEVARISEEERRKSEELSEACRRSALIDAAGRRLVRIANTLKESIMNEAPSLTPDISERKLDSGWRMRMGDAMISFSRFYETEPDPWKAYKPAFSVLAHAELGIDIPPQRDGYEGRRHSLWFCDAQEESTYQWFETAFYYNFFINKACRYQPFALRPGEEAGKALSLGITGLKVSRPFTLLDESNLAIFIDRWAGWLADASENKSRKIGSVQELSTEGSWRRK